MPEIKNKNSKSLSITTIDGLEKILSARNWFHRLIWLTLVLFSFVFCSYEIVNYVLEYLDYPVMTNTDVIFDDRPDFPTVKFCNHNKSNFSVMFNGWFFIKKNQSFREVNGYCSEFNSGNYLVLN